ncbi:Hypothetical predicted protein [Olea europaea subsp. europaea]|uniref:DUF1985 domain-containing protein n=1 Tax=Olea europaea subsp. europaea TaxID=158383 RepID=A0A8S0PB98_OLEEU|nr:Hypothetical predicted protein [Olea europaea subsp. europaea]
MKEEKAKHRSASHRNHRPSLCNRRPHSQPWTTIINVEITPIVSRIARSSAQRRRLSSPLRLPEKPNKGEEEVRLRAHISQRSNLKYVKTVMDLFDDRLRDEFRNSPFGYLAEVAEIQFSAQLIQQLVFRTIRTDKVNELWFNVQGNMMRFGLQEYTLVMGLRYGVFPEGDEFDRVLERRRLKERVGYRRLLHVFRGFWAKKFLKAKRRQEKEVTYTIHGFPIAMQVWACEAVLEIGERMSRLLRWSARKQPQHRTYDAFFKNVRLHIYATLRPTDVEAEQQYFSTLVPYDDPPVPVLDEIARNVVGLQFNASHGGSGNGGLLVRQESDDGVSSGGSGEDEMSGNEGVDTEESGEGASERSSVGADTCRGQTGASSTPPATHVSSPVRGSTMETRPVGTSGQASPKRRWKSCCSTKEFSLKWTPHRQA